MCILGWDRESEKKRRKWFWDLKIVSKLQQINKYTKQQVYFIDWYFKMFNSKTPDKTLEKQ